MFVAINRTFVQWPYLGCFIVASFVLLIASMVLGIVCRINFGKGLAEYCGSSLPIKAQIRVLRFL